MSTELLIAELGRNARRAQSVETFIAGALDAIRVHTSTALAGIYIFDDSGVSADLIEENGNIPIAEELILFRTSPPEKSETLRSRVTLSSLQATEEKLVSINYLPIDGNISYIVPISDGPRLRGIIFLSQGEAPLDSSMLSSVRGATKEFCPMLDLVIDRFLQYDLVHLNQSGINLIDSNPMEVIEPLLELIRLRIGCEGISFLYRDYKAEEESFTIRASQPKGIGEQEITYKISDANLTTEAIKMKRTLSVHYTKKSRTSIQHLNAPKWRDVPEPSTSKSVIYCPILRQSSVVGLVRCTNKIAPHPSPYFSAVDIRKLEAFSSHLITWFYLAEQERDFAENLLTISHEIKNACAGIKSAALFLNFAQRSEKNALLSEELPHKVGHIVKSCDAMVKWIPALRLAAKAHIMSGDFREKRSEKPFMPYADLTKSVSEEFADEARRRHLSFTHNGETQLGLLYADINDFKIIFRNLIHNAIKYTKPGNTIFISHSRSSAHAGHARITVASDSIPIQNNEVKNLFFNGYRASSARNSREPGEGMGLSTAKSYARSYRGDVIFNRASDLNAFTILIPNELFRPTNIGRQKSQS